MDIEDIREYCLSKKGVTEGFPFNETTLAFKVMGKIFVLASLEGVLSVNLKCDPDWAIELRDKYPAVQPGYHMNKKHWNTLFIDGSMREDMISQQIDHSYNLVVAGLSKKIREKIKSHSHT